VHAEITQADGRKLDVIKMCQPKVGLTNWASQANSALAFQVCEAAKAQ
jgi:hypothetical protein